MSGRLIVVDFQTGVRVGSVADIHRSALDRIERLGDDMHELMGARQHRAVELAADIRKTRRQLELALGAGDTERSSALRAQLSRLKIERDRLHRGGAA